MAGWTKAQYDAAYSFRVERYLGGHPPDRDEVRVNYHQFSMGPIMEERWRQVILVLSPTIIAADKLLVIGAGFGWGVDAIMRRTPATVIGIDNSTYIHTEKGNDDSAEISAKVSAVGLDPATGRGLEILNAVKTTGAKTKAQVLDEDYGTELSRQNVSAALGGDPTRIVVEDVVDDSMTDAEIITLAGDLDQSSARKVWLYTPTKARTSEQLNVLTGHQVIEFGSYRLIG